METVKELETTLAAPSERLVKDLARIDGDLMILGVGGKMGPSLARLAKNAVDGNRPRKRVIGVSRFSSERVRRELEEAGVETIVADLLREKDLQNLPNVKNILYMAGKKFGTLGHEHGTWAMNAYLPGRVAEKFRQSRIVCFSTGNLYSLTPLVFGGKTEDDPPDPVGEYAQSCLGRERIFEYFSRRNGTPMLHFRLNYAIDLRYGVLLEIALAVKKRQAIDLSMGSVNVIWQGDANEAALRSLTLCQSPPKVLNVTGPENVSVRWLACQFGSRFGVEPVFTGQEKDTALLSNAAIAHQLFGYPRVSLRQMIEWTYRWVEAGGTVLEKPTRFQERQGVF
ncbi:NAD-dependent epimerase/dehydratase family protein [Salinithrix halophila]|uniref:NAD-dependent epimerase/dehydratase family protein n=1 Tax=Salinithrix halophila TaxID=1485204 RepID=A0ABV8JB66_9BACL